MMDRALGAISTGSTATTDIQEAVNRFGMVSTIHEANQWGLNTTIEELIQNPSTHYNKGDGTNNVPIASTEDLTKDWWNPEIKTLYDPCPNGYRIPKHGTYGERSDWVISNPYSGLTSGYNWKASFFPANGCRIHTSGKFRSVGMDGFYGMSTTTNSDSGHVLYFNSSTIKFNTTEYAKARGYHLRCIEDKPVMPTGD